MADITNIAVLVVLLVALAGVIAYTGDVLGTLVGKRRLSLFGVRPKQSGRIIGVFAGILIMLVTLGTLALSFRNAVQVIMSAQPVGEQLAEQRVQLRRSTAQVDALQGQVEARTQELAQAQDEVKAAETARDQARADVTTLQATQEELQGSVDDLNERVAELNTLLNSTQADLNTAEANLTQAQQQAVEADQARQQAVDEADKASQEAASSRQEVETLTAEVVTAQTRLGSVRDELADSRRALETAQTDLADTQTRLTDTQAELQKAQNDLEQADGAREQALQAQQEAEARAKKLQENIDGLERKAEELSTQNSELSVQNNDLSTQNAELETAADELVQVNSELAQLNIRLRNQTETLNARLQTLQDTNAELTQTLERQTNDLNRAKEEAEAINSLNISYDINQVIHSGIITAQEPPAIRVQLAQLVQAASEKAVLRGGLDVVLTPKQSESIVTEAAQTPGEDIVLLRSKMNQYISAPVLVAVEVAPNQKLLTDGQLLVSRQIFLGTGSRDDVRDDLVKVLTDANTKLLGLGLTDEVYPSLAETSLEVEGFTNQLLRLKGPVTVGLAASDAIFAGGPARLEFVIVN